MGKLTKNELEEIADFVIDYYDFEETDRNEIESFLYEHAAYNTLMVIRNNSNEIIALCRWNILLTGQDAFIMDIVIRPDYRNKRLMYRMLLKGLNMYPEVKYLVFERRTKGQPFVKFPVSRLLKRRI